jgi:hypothetical protein
MVPSWLSVISWISLTVALVSAALIAADIYAAGYRQRMRVMEAVWPVTALYFGPAAIWAYRAWGRPQSRRRGAGPGRRWRWG